MSRLDWQAERERWPNADYSAFVSAGALRWHIQRAGHESAARPKILLVHGTSASTHSWRDNLLPLASAGDVLAMDLPGHGFTERPAADRLSLPAMAHQLGQLLAALSFVPDLVVGHSAGAAILIRMALDGQIAPRHIVSLNGALYPFEGRTPRAFPALARALLRNPLVPRVFALGAGQPKRVARLIEGTGSHLDANGLALYGRLFACSDHAGAALGMMARWDLDALDRDIDDLRSPLTLVVGERDRAVPPARAADLARRLADAGCVTLPGLGHLAHEEAPDVVNALFLEKLEQYGLTD